MNVDPERRGPALTVDQSGSASDSFSERFFEIARKESPGNRLDFGAGEPLETPPASMGFIYTGWAGIVRELAKDRSQIVLLLLPGDLIPDPEPDADRPSRIEALTKLTVFTLSRDPGSAPPDARTSDLSFMADLHRKRLWRHALEHVVRLSLLSAYEKVGHFLLEIHERLHRVELVASGQFLVPISQEKIGRILGLSEAHINRVLKQLGRDGFLRHGPGWVCMTDPEALASRVHYPPFRTGNPELDGGIGASWSTGPAGTWHDAIGSP